jgi:methionyl-tRNA formyltransferase
LTAGGPSTGAAPAESAGAAGEPRPALRLVFFGSPPFATPILAALLRSAHRPLAVVTAAERPAGRGRRPQPSPIAELAQAAAVPCLRPQSVRDPQFRTELAAFDADVFLVASYGALFDRELLALPRQVCLNVHGSLLPRWRGASPVQAALLAGDAVTGISIQRMVRELDAGDLLLTESLTIGPEEHAGQLFERLSALAGPVALAALDLLAAGRATFRPQDPAGVTHCRKLGPEAGLLDFAAPAAELERRVRAVTPWPGARTHLPDGRALLVRRAAVGERAVAGAPGTLDPAGLLEGRLCVATGAGSLELLAVQPEGRRELGAAEFLRGTRLAAGARLGGLAP